MGPEMMEHLPPEMLMTIFMNLDGAGIYKAMRTCKSWYGMVDCRDVWEAASKRAGLLSALNSNESSFMSFLPTVEEVQAFLKPATPHTPWDWKKYYRLAATCLVVDSIPVNVSDINDAVREHFPQTVLRRNRIFKDLNEALAAAQANDYIYIRKGSLREEVNVRTPVNICGQMYVKERVYLQTEMKKRIVWEAQGGSIVCVNFTTHLNDVEACLEVVGSVQARFCLFKNTNNAGLKVGPNAAASVLNSSFSGCRMPVVASDNIKSLSMQQNYISDEFPPSSFQAIVDRMNSTDDVDVQLGLCQTISDLNKSDVNRKRLISALKSGVLEIILRLLERNRAHEGFAIFSTNFVHDLSKIEDLGTLLLQHYTPTIVSKVMRAQPTIRAVQLRGCSIIWNLLVKRECSDMVDNGDFDELLISVLSNYKGDTPLCMKALGALWNISWLSNVAGKRLLESGGLHVLYDLMDTYPLDKGIHENCTGVMWNIAAQETLAESIVEQGGVEHVLKSMKSISNAPRIHWLGCAVLINLVRNDDDRARVYVQGGIEVILDALRRYPTDDEVQARTDGILCKLLSLEVCRREFVRLQGVEVCMESLKIYLSEPHPNAETPPTGLSRTLNEAFLHDDCGDAIITALNAVGMPDPIPAVMLATGVLQSISFHPERAGYLVKRLDLINFVRSALAVRGLPAAAFLHLVDIILNVSSVPSVLEANKEAMQSIACDLVSHSIEFGEKERSWAISLRNTLSQSVIIPGVHLDMGTKARHCHVSADRLTVRNPFLHFSSIRGNKFVTRGKWYYEVEIIMDGCMQIGWLTDKCQKMYQSEVTGNGVGDDTESWACDFDRLKKWHQLPSGESSVPYGATKWKPGDTVQCWLDLDAKTMSFGLNGTCTGVAFDAFIDEDAECGFTVGISLSLNCEVRFNFGASAFKFPPDDPSFKPICDA